MTYSENALAFSKIPVSKQVRVEDRISFLYLDYCKILQDETGVIAVFETESEVIKRKLLIPVAGLAVLFLGPGTSITQPAITSCTRSGLTVIFGGQDGVGCYGQATPLTSSSRWAIAQAKLISDKLASRKAAQVLYKEQLGIPMEASLTISQMRGIEGRLIRQTYKEQARLHGIKKFRRDTNETDTINVVLNTLNGIMYGCAASVCSALSVNPALGIIHRGDIRALLFDLADVYKPSVTIPIAFRSAKEDEPVSWARTALRKKINELRILERMLEILMKILAPHLPERMDDRLVDDEGFVSGHTQYGAGE